MPIVPPLEPVASPGQPIGVAGPIVSMDLKVPPYCFPAEETGEAVAAVVGVEEAASLEVIGVVAAATVVVETVVGGTLAAGLALDGAMVAGVEEVPELQLVTITAQINRANVTNEILFMQMPPLPFTQNCGFFG